MNIFEKLITIAKENLILILIITFLFTFTPDINSAPKRKSNSNIHKSRIIKKKFKKRRISRRKRSYNPIETRKNALELLRRTSEELCMIANLEPIFDSGNFVPIDDTEEDFEEEGDVEYSEAELNKTQNNNTKNENIEIDDGNYEDEPVDIETFKTLWLSYVDDSNNNEYTIGGFNKTKIMQAILSWLGTPYRFGGQSRKAIDCSAFIREIFKEVANIDLPRTARTQIYEGEPISRAELEFGDLVFFHTYNYAFASHVGIYLADGLFAHASSKWGVTISSLNSQYYSTHFIGARRLRLTDFDHYANN